MSPSDEDKKEMRRKKHNEAARRSRVRQAEKERSMENRKTVLENKFFQIKRDIFFLENVIRLRDGYADTNTNYFAQGKTL